MKACVLNFIFGPITQIHSHVYHRIMHAHTHSIANEFNYPSHPKHKHTHTKNKYVIGFWTNKKYRPTHKCRCVFVCGLWFGVGMCTYDHTHTRTICQPVGPVLRVLLHAVQFFARRACFGDHERRVECVFATWSSVCVCGGISNACDAWLSC